MGTRASSVAALLSLLLFCPLAGAADRAPSAGGESAAAAPSSEAVAEAADHFQKARALYQAGSYREAIDELERAHKLDPTAKDLVYNLSLVSEKLGRLDDALRYMHSYEEMDLTPPERARAEAAIRRLEGARREVPPTPPPAASTAAPPPEPPHEPASAPHGRIDVLTIGAAAVAVAGFAVGTVFAIKASGDKPQAGTVTESAGSYTDLAQRADDAHKEAIVADVGFAVGLVASVGTAILYFGREKTPSRAAPPPARGSVEVVPAAGSRGPGFLLRGTF